MEKTTLNLNEQTNATYIGNDQVAIHVMPPEYMPEKQEQVTYLSKEEIEKLYNTFCK